MFLAEPVVNGTLDPQVKLQGTASFDQVPVVEDLEIKAAVNGTNFVIADHTGVNLTGLSVTAQSRTGARFDGLTVAGQLMIGYTRGTNTYSFGGGVTVTSQSQNGGNVCSRMLPRA